MKRVLVGGFVHETSSFVPGLTDLSKFRYYEGPAMLGPEHGSGQVIDGIIEVAKEEGIELIPTINGYAGANPPVTDSAYQYFKDRILAGLRQNQGRLDGVMLPLHGAMCTESLEDPEGDLITAVRQIVGPAVPISVGMDMHCHMTDLTLKPSDSIVGYHTHPHVDFFDTGLRGMKILARALKGEVKPVVGQRKIRMVTSAETHNTSHGPMGEIMGRILEMEKEPGILAATVFATQPWMDVPQLGWSTVVVADGDRDLAQRKADELAAMCWERRERFLVLKTLPQVAVQAALASESKPWVLTDSSDSVTGGGFGDGNGLLKTLLQMRYQDTAMITLTDPEASRACFAAGVGGEVTVAVGGKLTPQFYQPVTVTGKVKMLSDGQYWTELAPRLTSLGRTAVLQVGGISLLISENKAPTIDAGAYRSHGLEPKKAKIVQVKSPGGFRAIYGPFAAGIFELEIPGPCDSELPRLPFKKIRRPLWPFDPDLKQPW